MEENTNQGMTVCQTPDFVQLDRINDDLHAVRRILDRPDIATQDPAIMDLIRISVCRIHDQYTNLAFDMRRRTKNESS